MVRLLQKQHDWDQSDAVCLLANCAGHVKGQGGSVRMVRVLQKQHDWNQHDAVHLLEHAEGM